MVGFIATEIFPRAEPLEPQIGVWRKKSCPDTLRFLFEHSAAIRGEFSTRSATCETAPIRTYAILDAARISLLPDLLEGADVNHRILFQGEAEDSLQAAAPYLVELVEGNDFTRQLFGASGWAKTMWNEEPGLFIRSRHSLATLRAHFRKFTRLRDEAGKWYYFRFWDELAFASGDEPWLPHFFSHPEDQLITRIGADFRRMTLSAGAGQSEGPLIMTGGWKAQIALRHQASYARGILQRDHRETARKLNPALQREWAMVIARAFLVHDLRKSWSKEQYIKHSLLLGTHFDRDATLPLMRDHLLRDEPCFLRMLGLQEEMDRLMPEVLGPGFSHYSQALEQFSGLSLQQALALVAHDDPLSQVLNFYPQKANQLTADSLARMSQRCNSLAASVFEGAEMRSGAVVLFAHAFILGEGSLDDPLHDYLRRFLRSERPNKAQLLFSYGQRRARAQLREIAKFNESE